MWRYMYIQSAKIQIVRFGHFGVDWRFRVPKNGMFTIFASWFTVLTSPMLCSYFFLQRNFPVLLPVSVLILDLIFDDVSGRLGGIHSSVAPICSKQQPSQHLVSHA